MWLTQRIVFANVPHTLRFFVHNSSLIIHHSHPHKNRQNENQGNDGEEQSTACPHGKGEPERLVLPVDKERHQSQYTGNDGLEKTFLRERWTILNKCCIFAVE